MAIDFNENIKWKEENLWKHHKTSLATGGSAPPSPWEERTFHDSYILSKSAQEIHAIYEK